ncbi:MAG: NAD(P)-dependent oxidoreductase [Planctomycetes bacterium]|nr:NAD(P)-dependent oxidoreductase [Planctomycetota bacterium]
MKTYLVTGATGFVGQHLCHRLLTQGNRVVTIVRDNEDVGFRSVIKIQGSVTDVETVRRAAARYELDGVFHLAAHAKVEECSRDPMGAWESNVRGTYVVLDTLHRMYARLPIVVATSDHAYGNHHVGDRASVETDPFVGGGGVYDTSKSCADMIAQVYMGMGADVRTVRCGNIYGPWDRDMSRAVPSFIGDVLHRRPIQIRSDGQAVREYLYIDDAIEGYIKVMGDYLAPGLSPPRGAYNFGGKVAINVIELAEQVTRAGTRAGYKRVGDPVILRERQGDIRQIMLDTSKAQRELLWKPKIDLSEGLDRTFFWWSRQ